MHSTKEETEARFCSRFYAKINYLFIKIVAFLYDPPQRKLDSEMTCLKLGRQDSQSRIHATNQSIGTQLATTQSLLRALLEMYIPGLQSWDLALLQSGDEQCHLYFTCRYN